MFFITILSLSLVLHSNPAQHVIIAFSQKPNTVFCKPKKMPIFKFKKIFTELLPSEALGSIFEGDEALTRMDWAVRFLVHVKCRGVLATKGYIACVHLKGG